MGSLDQFSARIAAQTIFTQPVLYETIPECAAAPLLARRQTDSVQPPRKAAEGRDVAAAISGELLETSARAPHYGGNLRRNAGLLMDARQPPDRDEPADQRH